MLGMDTVALSTEATQPTSCTEKSREEAACFGEWRGDISRCRRLWPPSAALSSSSDGREGKGGAAEESLLIQKGNSRAQVFSKRARCPWTLPKPVRRNLRRAEFL